MGGYVANFNKGFASIRIFDIKSSNLANSMVDSFGVFEVSKARRHFLHNEIQKLNITGAKGYVLEKHSRGDGRQRTLVVKKKPWNGEPSTLPSASARTSAPSTIHTGLMDFNQLLPEVSSNASNELGGPSITGPGHRLGGTVSKDTGKREASALAAERRMSVSQPLKRPRLSRPAVAAPVEPINTAASSSSESDSEDEELQKVMALSLEETKTPEIDEEERQLQEAMRLSLESTPSSQGNPSPQRFARLSAASSVLVALQGIFAAFEECSPYAPKESNIRYTAFGVEGCKSRRFEVPKPNLKHVVTFELHATL